MRLIVMLALFFMPVHAMDNNDVSIRTQDGYMDIAKRYTREMKIFQACHSKNRYFLSCNKDEVNLLIHTIEATQKNKLKKFLVASQAKGQLLPLLSAAYKFQATDLLALCIWHILPDLRKNISVQMMNILQPTCFYETIDRRIIEDYYDIGHFGIVDKKLCNDSNPCPDQTKSMRLKPMALHTILGYSDRQYYLEVFDTQRVLYELNVPDESIDYLDWESDDVIYAQDGSKVVCRWDLCLGQRSLSELDFLQWVFLYGLHQRVLLSPYEKLVLQKNSLKFCIYNMSSVFPDAIKRWIEQHITLEFPASSGGCECSIS